MANPEQNIQQAAPQGTARTCMTCVHVPTCTLITYLPWSMHPNNRRAEVHPPMPCGGHMWKWKGPEMQGPPTRLFEEFNPNRTERPTHNRPASLDDIIK